MDKKSITEFLNTFLGVRKLPLAPMSWDLRQLQYAGVHFAMSGDDAVLRQIFKWHIDAGRPGTYVDIGACSPVLISNTYLFYLMGWRGLCIDANAAFAESWKEARPEDTFLVAATGEAPGTAYWFQHATNKGMSQVRADNVTPGADYSAEGVPVPVERLDTLFARHLDSREIQLLSIDIEGGELDALKSNDWGRWRPEVIIMEALAFDMMRPRDAAAVSYLLDLGYGLEAKVGENVILKDRRGP